MGAVVGLASPSWADGEGWRVTRYDADVTVADDGAADVRVELDLDFGDEPGHGPFLTLPTRQAIEGDDERDRLFRISDVTASSETAPDDLDVETQRSGVVLRIGDEDVDDVVGAHTYTVTYRVEGWLNPAGTALGAESPPEGDELYLDVLGTGWEIPLEDISATVTGPDGVDVEQALCFEVEPGDGGPCATQEVFVEGSSAGFTLDRAEPGEPFTVLVVWPAGTFAGAEPILGEKLDELDPIRPTPLTGPLALLVAVGGGALAVGRARRSGRDRTALGLPTGIVTGSDRAFREHRPPVAVQSTPPADVLPGELGTLLDEVADPRDVVATIVDLAVRGHLEIREVGREEADDPEGEPGDWELVAAPGADRGALAAFERALLDGLFGGSEQREQVRMSEVRSTFASYMAQVQEQLYAHVTERGWFTANPRTVRRRWYLTGAALLVAGVVAGIVSIAALVDGLGLVAGALVLVGVLVLVLAKAAPARTASGTAVLAQAVAFKRYLETADADRLRLVHGEDLFSRYLPYAIVFGLTERWAGVFGDLAARGERVPEPSWYGGAPFAAWGGAGGFGSRVEGFATVATESLSAATPGSSGASGTSGGFAGGGVGGGGGGGW